MASAFLIAFTLAAAPAAAQVPAPRPTAAPAQEQKTCRRVETTGSILPFKRVCGNKADWSKYDKANADHANRFLDERRAGMRSGDN